MIIIVIKVKMLLASSLPFGTLLYKSNMVACVKQSLVMIIFRSWANTPEVSFVENNKERTAFLDSGLPVEARVIMVSKYIIKLAFTVEHNYSFLQSIMRDVFCRLDSKFRRLSQ